MNNIQQHGSFAVVTDDFGNATRYKNDALEELRQPLGFYVGDHIPMGSQIKTDMINQPYLKFDSEEVYVFNTKTEDWEKLNNDLTKTLFFEKYGSRFRDGSFRLVKQEEWNYPCKA